jgi:pantoate--beta-alanine ligase
VVVIETFDARAAVHARTAAWRRAGLKVGFVPTMGALHEGHLALVRASLAATDRTVVSIFVNPLQFAPHEDLAKYPRPLEKDRALLEAAGTHALYLPRLEEMYPPASETRVTAEKIAAPLCGAFRPGHFTGVLTVVLKLFHQVRPHVAFFGQKDYQQTAVLRRMVADLDLDLELEIRVEPTSRESDGLAMSSRNVYLAPDERRKAPAIKRALDAVRDAFAAGETRPEALLARGRAVLDAEGGFRTQYFELADPHTLEARRDVARNGDLVAVASYLGTTRLIDNVLL